MSCIITYKGQKYSEKQFKEYFINNKQEFVSPNAKLINGSKDFKFKINSDDVGITNGVYFSQNINLPNSYQEGTYINTDTTNKGIIPALVNITNPKYYNDVVDISVISDNNLQELRNENFDGAYTDMLSDDNLNSIQQDYNTEIVVFNPEQIHILGSKQDIEGFKKYVNKNNPIQQTITDLFNDLEIKKCGPGGGLFKAADGMKPKGFTKGGTWKIVKDLKGYPTHAKGGVDLSIGKDGVKMHNGTTQITAAFGLVIPMAADGMVVPDGEDPTNPPKKKIPGLDRMIKDNTMFSESTNIVKPVVEFNQTIKPKKDIIDNIKDKLDPRNIGLNDMSNEKDFNSAYAKARKSGDEQFLYNGDRYNTNYKGTPAQQLKETGILDEQLGVNKVVRDKIYKNVTPYNSIMPPIMQGVKGLITTDKNRDINVENPLPITYKGKPEDFRKLSAKEQARYKEEAKPHFKRADDAWALYTGNPQRFNTFEVSNHKPSTSTDPKANYLSVSKSYPEIVDFVKKEGTTLKQGESKQVQEPSNLVFRNFKISKGKDEKGEYISYYDKWNLNPSLEFPIPEQGKPFEIYDRIYLNDSKKK